MLAQCDSAQVNPSEELKAGLVVAGLVSTNQLALLLDARAPIHQAAGLLSTL